MANVPDASHSQQHATATVTASLPRSVFAVGVAVIALILALVLALSGFGAWWGWWHFSTGFTMLRWAAYGGIAVGVLSLVAIYLTRPGAPRRGLPYAVTALILSLLVFGIPYLFQQQARSVPPIHDITTDTENPPEFRAVAPLREDHENPTEYAGEDVASQQREAYPDIEPLVLDLPIEQAFERALDAAQDMGWEIVEADAEEARIEATSTVFWYGFKDDVSIRLSAANGGTRVDVRSQSRIGVSDLGVNARRVRSYLRRLQ